MKCACYARSLEEIYRWSWCTARTWRKRFVFFFQAEDGIRDYKVTGVQTCALPICGDGADHARRRRLRNLCTTRYVALGVGARGAYTRGHSEIRHGDVCLPEPAPRLRVPPSWRPRV